VKEDDHAGSEQLRTDGRSGVAALGGMACELAGLDVYTSSEHHQTFPLLCPQEETDSLLVTLNVGKWRRQQEKQQQQQQQQQQGHPKSPPAHPQMSDVTHTMPQIDFTSTLALLMGVPVPFGNVGSVNEGMWAAAWEGGAEDSNSSSSSDSNSTGSERGESCSHSFLQPSAVTSMQVGAHRKERRVQFARMPPPSQVCLIKVWQMKAPCSAHCKVTQGWEGCSV